MATELCCISRIYETLLLLVMSVIFCRLHCSHPANWGAGLTVVLLIIPLKDSFKGIQRVLGLTVIGVFISGLLRDSPRKSGVSNVFLNEIPLWAENSECLGEVTGVSKLLAKSLFL